MEHKKYLLKCTYCYRNSTFSEENIEYDGLTPEGHYICPNCGAFYSMDAKEVQKINP